MASTSGVYGVFMCAIEAQREGSQERITRAWQRVTEAATFIRGGADPARRRWPGLFALEKGIQRGERRVGGQAVRLSICPAHIKSRFASGSYCSAEGERGKRAQPSWPGLP